MDRERARGLSVTMAPRYSADALFTFTDLHRADAAFRLLVGAWVAAAALAAARAAQSGQYVAPDHIRSASSRLSFGRVGSGLCFQPEARSSSMAKKRATSGASKKYIGEPRRQRSHHAKCLVLETGTSTPVY